MDLMRGPVPDKNRCHERARKGGRGLEQFSEMMGVGAFSADAGEVRVRGMTLIRLLAMVAPGRGGRVFFPSRGMGGCDQIAHHHGERYENASQHLDHWRFERDGKGFDKEKVKPWGGGNC